MASALRGFYDTFALHTSIESFLDSQPEGSDPNVVVRTKLLNRNVAIASSHRTIRLILSSSSSMDTPQSDDNDPEPYCAAPAFAPFMAAFFPSPNLLLSDGAVHTPMRRIWEKKMQPVPSSSRTQDLVRDLTAKHFRALLGQQADLYSSLKDLAWKLLLGLFLGLEEHDPAFAQIQGLQEDLLRAQFSLFPVSVDLLGFWKSPRKTGLNAKTKLQQLLRDRLRMTTQHQACPFLAKGETRSSEDEMNDIANHLLLFTSSLAAKGLASLTSALLLNIFVHERDGVRLCDELAGMPGEDRKKMLRSIQLETERLSPPIVGTMRRVMRDEVIHPVDNGGAHTSLPKGSDVWLYFLRGGRDASVFGRDAEQFVPERFVDCTNEDRRGFSFAAGTKKCLGQDLVREVCLATGQTMLDLGFQLDGRVADVGVRAWLGWDGSAVGQDWQRDMRQLPVQHPRHPVVVRVTASQPTGPSKV